MHWATRLLHSMRRLRARLSLPPLRRPRLPLNRLLPLLPLLPPLLLLVSLLPLLPPNLHPLPPHLPNLHLPPLRLLLPLLRLPPNRLRR